jgi:hypothetical protein
VPLAEHSSKPLAALPAWRAVTMTQVPALAGSPWQRPDCSPGVAPGRRDIQPDQRAQSLTWVRETGASAPAVATRATARISRRSRGCSPCALAELQSFVRKLECFNRG